MSSSDTARSTKSISNPYRVADSPPYEISSQGLPPIYQSRTNLNQSDQQQNSSNDSASVPFLQSAGFHPEVKRKQPSDSSSHPPSTDIESHLLNSKCASTLSRSGTTDPRVNIIDPLAEYRSKQLSKPEGLSADSDYPPLEINRMHTTPTLTPTSFGRPQLNRRDSDLSSEGDQQFDDFDWSDEDDIDQAARFQDEAAKQIRMGRLSLYKILRFLAVTFLGNLIVSCALVIPVFVIQFVYRRDTDAKNPNADHRNFVADNVQAWFIWAAFNLNAEWWIHILVEMFPRAVLGLIQLVWGRPSQNVKSLAEVFNTIKNYCKLILYAALSWGSWAIIFTSIFHLYNNSDPQHSRAPYLERIYQVMEFFFFFILTICVEKVVIKYIAMSFHKSAYAERVANVTQSLKVFDHLKDHKPKVRNRDNHSAFGFSKFNPRNNNSTFGFSKPSPHGTFTSAVPGEAGTSTLDSSFAPSSSSKPSWFKKHSRKRPAVDSMTSGGNLGRAPAAGEAPARGDGRARLFAKAAAKRAARGGRKLKTTAAQASTLARIAMNDPYGLLHNETLGIGADINSPSQAKRLARSIFIAFRANHKRSYLVPSDFQVAYANLEDAKDAFAVFDRDANGDISQTEIKNTVMHVFKERRFLSRSMQDVNHAVGQLDSILIVIAFAVIMFEALAIFNVNIKKTLTTFYSLAIAFAFVFKESAANVFDSIIFLFLTHPFDTGDRVMIKENVFVVKKMSLLSCLFVDSLGQDVYISNSILSSACITNFRRSGYQWESIAAQFAFDTPLEKMDAVEADMIHWLQTEPERLFVPSTAIVPQKIEYMRSLDITIGMTHADTWQDWGRRFYRRNAFFAAFCYYCKKHGIRWANSVQPIVYWAEDAAQLPPKYNQDEDSDPGACSHGLTSGRGRNVETAAALMENGYDQDDFSPSPPPTPTFPTTYRGGIGSSLSTGAHPPPRKPKILMNFTPPPDEIDGAHIRLRTAKRSKMMLTTQGGAEG